MSEIPSRASSEHARPRLNSVTGFSAALLLHLAATIAAAQDKPPEITSAQATKLIKDLGDDDFGIREQASKDLEKGLGLTPNFPLLRRLREALASDDAEIVARAKGAINGFTKRYCDVRPTGKKELPSFVPPQKIPARADGLVRAFNVRRFINGWGRSSWQAIGFDVQDEDRQETTRELVEILLKRYLETEGNEGLSRGEVIQLLDGMQPKERKGPQRQSFITPREHFRILSQQHGAQAAVVRRSYREAA